MKPRVLIVDFIKNYIDKTIFITTEIAIESKNKKTEICS